MYVAFRTARARSRKVCSVAMMLRHSFGRAERAHRIHRAAGAVLREGCRTADIFQPGMRQVGTEEMGAAMVAALRSTGA